MKSPFGIFIKFSLGTWVNAISAAVSIPIITWYISPDEFGKASMFILAYNLLLSIVMLGQDQSYARHYNERVGRGRIQLLSDTTFIALSFTLILVSVVEILRFPISRALFNRSDNFFVELLTISLIAGVINRFNQLILRMKGHALRYSLLQIALAVTNLLFTVVYALLVNRTFEAVVVSFVLSQIICLIVGLFLERRTWYAVLKNSIQEIKENLKYGTPFVPTFFVDWAFQSSDRALLRIYSSFEQLGQYSLASRISFSLNVIQTGFNTFWTPFVFEKYNQNEKNRKFYNTTFEYLYLSFSFLILGIISFKNFLTFILSNEYQESINLFSLLLIVPMVYTLSEITGVGINLKKRTILHFYTILLTATISLIFGFTLIPSLGAQGAVLTNVFSNVSLFILRSVFGNSLYKLNLNWGKFLVTMLILLFPLLAIFFWRVNGLCSVFSIVLIIILHRKIFTGVLNKLKSNF